MSDRSQDGHISEGDELCVEFLPESKHLRDTLAKGESGRILREVCREIMGREIGLRLAIKNADDDTAMTPQDHERREQQHLREIAERHPGVQQLLKTFRGEIVEVRKVSSEQ